MSRYCKFFIFITSIILLITVLLRVEQKTYAAEQKVYIVGVNNSNNILEMQSVIVTVASLVKEKPFDESSSYRIALLSANNTILYETRFDFMLTYEYKEITIPYFSNGKEIKIYDKNGKIVISESVMQFAQTCGNKICEPYESYESCPADCHSGGKDDYCDAVKDNICDPDCLLLAKDSDCVKSQKIKGTSQSLYLIAGIAVVTFGLIGLIYWRIKRRKRLMEY